MLVLSSRAVSVKPRGRCHRASCIESCVKAMVWGDRYRSLSRSRSCSQFGAWTPADAARRLARNLAAASPCGRGFRVESENPAVLLVCSPNWNRIKIGPVWKVKRANPGCQPVRGGESGLVWEGFLVAVS